MKFENISRVLSSKYSDLDAVRTRGSVWARYTSSYAVYFRENVVEVRQKLQKKKIWEESFSSRG